MPGNVNFYLKKKEESTGKSLIYLKYKYSGETLPDPQKDTSTKQIETEGLARKIHKNYGGFLWIFYLRSNIN